MKLILHNSGGSLQFAELQPSYMQTTGLTAAVRCKTTTSQLMPASAIKIFGTIAQNRVGRSGTGTLMFKPLKRGP
jgi:hypothetical protein